MRLSRVIRQPEDQQESERVSIRSAILWALVAIAIIGGIVLYFRFERYLVPILG